MPRIHTLGSKNRRTEFNYEGSVKSGVELLFSGNPKISAEFFNEMLNTFSGKTVKGGFSMTNPSQNGFGSWIATTSSNFGRKLTPRHASFISALLVHEGYITSSLNRNAIILHFPKKEDK